MKFRITRPKLRQWLKNFKLSRTLPLKISPVIVITGRNHLEDNSNNERKLLIDEISLLRSQCNRFISRAKVFATFHKVALTIKKGIRKRVKKWRFFLHKIKSIRENQILKILFLRLTHKIWRNKSSCSILIK